MALRLIIPIYILLSLYPGNVSSEERAKTPQELFLEARNAYLYGNYASAIRGFRSLLYPEPGLLKSDTLRREAHKYLGISYFYLAQRSKKREYYDAARRELLRYLLLDPKAQLDPLLYPPQLVSFFNSIRRDNARRLQQILLKLKKRRTAQQPPQIVTVTLERRVYLNNPILAILPFGLAQFANGHYVKGFLLMGGELISLGLNIAAYFSIYSLQIKSGPQRGYFRPKDIGTVKTLQIVQFASFGVFSALLAYGLIDGIVFFRRKKTVLLPRLPPVPPDKLKSFQ